MKVFLLWTALVVSETTAQLLLKLGAGNFNLQTDPYGLDFKIIGGYALYIISFLIWMQILKFTKLYIALAAASVVFITIAIGSHYLLGEPVTFNTLIGTICVSCGIFIIGNAKRDAR
jgi:drug/metabolite transporter (DMT)-like permease